MSTDPSDVITWPRTLALSPACSGCNSTWSYHHPFSATQQNDVSMKTWQRNVAHDTRGPRLCPFPWGCGSPAHHLLLSHNVKRPTSHADPRANSPCQLQLECRIVLCHNSCCKSPSTSHSLTYYAISPQRCNHIRYL